MDAVEDKRNLKEVASGDEKRERAPVRGLKVRCNPMEPVDLVGIRERAPAKGVNVSDIPTLLLDSTSGGGNKGTLGSGKGKREQAPAQEARVSDDLSALLDEDAMYIPETSAGNASGRLRMGRQTRDFPLNRLIRRAGWEILAWPSRWIRKW